MKKGLLPALAGWALLPVAALGSEIGSITSTGSGGHYGVATSADAGLVSGPFAFGTDKAAIRTLTEADQGQLLELTGPDLAGLIAALTNGVDDGLNVRFGNGGTGASESIMLASVPGRTGPDLAGFPVHRITLEVAAISLDSPGGDPNGNGQWTDYSFTLVFRFHVPDVAVGGQVSGLQGSGLVLANGAGEELPVAASGTFEFASLVAGGSDYDVTVVAQPTAPAQTCVVANGSGTAGHSAVTDVEVTCTNNGVPTLSTPHLGFVVDTLGELAPAQVASVTNTGPGTLLLGTLSIAGPDSDHFGFVSNDCDQATLGADESCSVAVDFGPLGVGPSMAEVRIPTDSVPDLAVITLGGSVTELFRSGFEGEPAPD